MLVDSTTTIIYDYYVLSYYYYYCYYVLLLLLPLLLLAFYYYYYYCCPYRYCRCYCHYQGAQAFASASPHHGRGWEIRMESLGKRHKAPEKKKISLGER